MVSSDLGINSDNMQKIFVYSKPIFGLLVLLFLGLWGCKSNNQKSEETKKEESKQALIKYPEFNADSAYKEVAAQVAFGPRIPNTKGHRACRKYLTTYFKSLGLEVFEQNFQEKNYLGQVMDLTNIIASYNPKAPKRILLAAHWDTRHIADQDTTRKNQAIDGANDGASGVAILQEIARAIQKNGRGPEDLGVDFLLIDGEDQGEPEDAEVQSSSEKVWWCLGSQYWASNKHKPGYSAYYGILLDMVGNKDAKFYKEGGSLRFAPSVVDKVWQTAQSLGYSQFVNQNVDEIIDDHVFINSKGGIPMIDIIEYDNSDGSFFSNTWHKHSDNISNIDRQTLKIVGQTVLTTIYQP
jgi:glutaminyl-peptide cyclotransferase